MDNKSNKMPFKKKSTVLNRMFCFLICCFLVACFTAVTHAADSSVVLTVTERAGVDRENEYVSFGVPVPVAWHIIDTAKLRILNSQGISIPAQFNILARWKSHANDTLAAAKWILVGFFADVPANSSQTFSLDFNGPGLLATTAISIDNTRQNKLIVDTGAAAFEINKTGVENLLNQVTVQGHQLLIPMSSGHAIAYEPIGTTGIVTGGIPNATPRSRSVTIERQGDLSTIVKITGSIFNDSTTPVLDYTARLSFFAGSSDVRVDFTVENNHPVIESDAMPTNIHDQGAPNSVYIGSLKLSIQLADTGSNLRVQTEKNVDLNNPASAVKLYQDSSGTDYWNAYVGNVGWGTVDSPLAAATPRLQSYCTRKGFTITGPDTAISGDQAAGWMSTSITSGPGIFISYNDFWQNFPKSIQAETNGTLVVDLFPNGSQFNHNLRVGEEKTHTFLYRFESAPMTAGKARDLARAFNKPLYAVAEPSWYTGTKALGDIPKADAAKWPLYENYVNVAFKPNPLFDAQTDDTGFGNTTLKQSIEKYNFYGWQDYGDVPLEYEAFGPNQAGQMNLKYWYVYGMLLQFYRSADLNWLDLAIPAAGHQSDVDFLHIPDTGIQHWSHGSYFGHSSHDEPGNSNPNRNYNSPSVDLFYGVPDLLLAYHLTGEQRFMETALDGLEAMANLSSFSNFTYPVFYRERACLIFAYLEGYKQTGDSRWLSNMKTIIQETMKTADKEWLTDPLAYIPPPGGPEGESERVSGFQICQVLWAVGRYLDFCHEYNLTDDTGAAATLEKFGDFIIDHLIKEISTYLSTHHPGEFTQQELSAYSGNHATIDSIWFTEDFETYLEINNWALLIADTLAYAYKYSGKQKYIDAAQKLYHTGTLDQVWLGDPPVYISSKDLVNSCNWGLVYMNEKNNAETNDCAPGDDLAAPQIMLPSGTVFDGSPEFIWTDDTNATWYKIFIRHTSTNTRHVQWYEKNGNDPNYPDVSCAQGECTAALGSVLETGGYEWWVRGWNDCGTGPWSDGVTFIVQAEDHRPFKIKLNQPSGTVQGTSPAFTWDEDASATWYQIYVRHRSTNTNYIKWYEIEDTWPGYPEAHCSDGECAATLDSILETGDYEWWVRGWNENGSGDWSDGMTFTTR